MSTDKLLYPFSEMGAGLGAPFDSLRFLLRHKGMLAALLAVHLALAVGYFYLVVRFGLPELETLLTEVISAVDVASLQPVMHWVVRVSVIIIAFLGYPLLGVPVANLLVSPLFDWVAQRAFEETAGIEAPSLTLRAMVRSLFFEVVRLALMIGILLLSLVSWVFVFFVPIVFLVSLWFFGWDHADRTLAILGFGMRKRLWFGIVHFLGCMSLGVWSYVPLFGSLLSFAMAGAGGIFVARILPAHEKERLAREGQLEGERKRAAQVGA